MSVGWLHHYLLSTTAGLPKNIARKEFFVWSEEYETFFKKHQNQIKIMSWSLGKETHIQITTNTL